ncbi:MAG: IMP cyclohydrolase [Lachnospiraceae bacterium]|nr:IMP cyclohydrolase [Lachnospiraceae bacterium]
MSIYDVNKFDELVKGNSYVGRGIIVGKSEDGKKAVTAYFIMGRSTNSRNRVFIKTNDGIMIEAYDPSKLEDPSLVIYSPVRQYKNYMIVTNGDQTDTAYDHIKAWDEQLTEKKSFFAGVTDELAAQNLAYAVLDNAFEIGLSTREFEPDGPNWTPRISAVLKFGKSNDFSYKMNILKSADAEGTACNRFTYDYKALAGVGHFIHTYNHDGNPIPTFTGEPDRVFVPNNIDEYTQTIWNGLDADNKVSLYVAYVDLETGDRETRIINKNER